MTINELHALLTEQVERGRGDRLVAVDDGISGYATMVEATNSVIVNDPARFTVFVLVTGKHAESFDIVDQAL